MSRIKGQWEDYDSIYDFWYCSNCGRATSGEPDICPYCGAQMAKGIYEEEDLLTKVIMKLCRRKRYGERMGND